MKTRTTPRWFLAATLLAFGALPASSGAQEPLTERDPELVPLVLVPGWGDYGGDVQTLGQRFLAAGWPTSRLATVSFEDPVGSNESHAREIARTVAVLRALTGAEEVDVVAHSMGGLSTRHYIQFLEGRKEVRRAVFLATPHRGTVAAVLAWGDGGREMAPGSEFLSRLNAGDAFPEEVEALAIRTPVDLRVIPGSSAMLPQARNVEICCPTHTGLLDDDRTFEEVRLFLVHGSEQVRIPDDTIPLRSGGAGWGPRNNRR